MKDKKAKIITDAICGLLMTTSILVYLVLGFVLNFWHPGWLIIVCSAFVSGIITIITNMVIDLKKASKEETNQDNN